MSIPRPPSPFVWLVVLSTACLSTGCVKVSRMVDNRRGSLSGAEKLKKGFNRARGIDGLVLAIAYAKDGSGAIYVGGEFSAYLGHAVPRFARLNADGTLDSTFSVGTGFDAAVSAILPLDDGTGRVVVAGVFTHYRGKHCGAIIRLNRDGSPDETFASGTGFDSTVLALAPAGTGGGAIYVGGYFTHYDGGAASRIARLTSDGKLDGNFSYSLALPSWASVSRLATGPSGAVYVAGMGLNPGDGSTVGFVKLGPDGSPDQDYGSRILPSLTNSMVFDVAVVPGGSGDVFIAASRALMRVSASGNPMTSFHPDPAFGFPSRFVPLQDGTGRLLLTYELSLNDCPGIVLLQPDGSRDPTFQPGDGFRDFDPKTGRAQSSNWDFRALALAPDGKSFWVGGWFGAYQHRGLRNLVHLDTTGKLADQPQLGAGLHDQTQRGVSALAVTPAGDAVFVAGTFSSYDGTPTSSIVKIRSSGDLASEFKPSDPNISEPQTLVLDDNGSLYVGLPRAPYLLKLKPNGEVDPSFQLRGSFDQDFREFPSPTGQGGGGYVLPNGVHALALDPLSPGKIYVGGDFQKLNGSPVGSLIRLNPDGSLDTSFVPEVALPASVLAIAPIPDGSGRIYVGGSFVLASPHGNYRGAVRLGSTGAIDPDFHNDQFMLSSNAPGYAPILRKLLPRPDGSVYVGGDFDHVGQQQASGVMRLLPSGDVDSEFNPGVGFGVWGRVWDVAPAPGRPDNVVMVGEFTQFNQVRAGGIFELDPRGAPVRTFGTGFDAGLVRRIALWGVDHRSLIVGGAMNVYQGTTVENLVSLGMDGTLY